MAWELSMIRWILQNYYRNPSVKKMAAAFGMSYTSFYRKFRQWYGLSPKRYVQDLRMQEVERLLIETNISLKEISFSLSFSSQSELCAKFRKRHGMTPTAFRRRSWGSLQV